MATIPWSTSRSAARPTLASTATGTAGPAGPATAAPVAMASRFTLTSRRHTVAMLRHALRIRRTLLTAPGALGVSLVARPARGEYWTLSAWADRASLDAFVGTPDHRAAMRRLAPVMADATFTFWPCDAADRPPTWPDARSRVEAELAKPAG
jgi:quinol monooxygenase YgiN